MLVTVSICVHAYTCKMIVCFVTRALSFLVVHVCPKTACMESGIFVRQSQCSFLFKTMTAQNLIHVVQSRVEIEGYSIAYFDRVVVFEAPCFVDAWISNEIYESHMSPALTGSSAIRPLPEVQQYDASKAAICVRNTRQNNLRFLHGTATHVQRLGISHHISTICPYLTL